MLTVEQNERLTRVGPGTPCGELMRRYWIPIAPFARLLEEPVQKVRVLGEDLVLYRNTKGGLGLIGDRCLHRRVDMKYGIPDENGLRCPYHGWLYGATGACLERPMELANAQFNDKLKGYPVEELGGLVFAYLGPLPAPALPRWDLFVWPNAVRQIAINVLDCNWLQCQENTGDPTHSVWAHGHMFKYELDKKGAGGRSEDATHTIHSRLEMGVGIKELYAKQTQYGMEKGIVYSKELGAKEDRVRKHSTVIFPFYTQTGTAGAPRSEYQIRVPMDDTHTLHICYQVYAGPPGVEAPRQDVVPWYAPPTVDADGKPILDYVLAQDAIVWVAQGAIVDRSQEKLGRTDVPIVLLRRQLDEQITLVEQGKAPMNFFPGQSPDMLHGSGKPPDDWTAPDWAKRRLSIGQAYRQKYHKGFAIDDVDRYGPAVPLVQDLHRRIEEAEIKALEEA
ncbi:Rieske 2Fe-2S domain-containing protein [Roseiarcaceae bacterium H3SJ34-1]|uniref:Rieske 2Fe-2S domain-containing protein n=1 Tax=Terripilifer ovatus TaxID=3032367 RepID=UPI003AB9226B|nr:Rieske 2Fe-2S domain-containing protein [Roseiarcaceae bacterium H3SJ34-1]